jgi:hypothetical protein
MNTNEVESKIKGVLSNAAGYFRFMTDPDPQNHDANEIESKLNDSLALSSFYLKVVTNPKLEKNSAAKAEVYGNVNGVLSTLAGLSSTNSSGILPAPILELLDRTSKDADIHVDDLLDKHPIENELDDGSALGSKDAWISGDATECEKECTEEVLKEEIKVRVAELPNAKMARELLEVLARYEESSDDHSSSSGYDDNSSQSEHWEDNVAIEDHFSPPPNDDESTSSYTEISSEVESYERPKRKTDDDQSTLNQSVLNQKSFKCRRLFGSPDDSPDQEMNEGESDMTTTSQVDEIRSESAHDDEAATNQYEESDGNTIIDPVDESSTAASGAAEETLIEVDMERINEIPSESAGGTSTLLPSSSTFAPSSVDFQRAIELQQSDREISDSSTTEIGSAEVYEAMLEDYAKYGIAAGHPDVPHAMREFIAITFSEGRRLLDIPGAMGSFMTLLNAKSKCTELYAAQIKRTLLPFYDIHSTFGDQLYCAESKEREDSIHVSRGDRDWETVMEAIRRSEFRNEHQDEMGNENIGMDDNVYKAYFDCGITKRLQNLVNTGNSLSVAIIAMSYLLLPQFCSHQLLEMIVDLHEEIYPGVEFNVNVCVREYIESVHFPALASGNQRLVKLAAEILIQMKLDMLPKARGGRNDAIREATRLVFSFSQTFRIDGKGTCSSSFDFCGRKDTGNQGCHSIKRSQMIGTFFSLCMAPLIEAEFPANFFKQIGSFSEALLCGALRDMTTTCNLTYSKEFLTLVFGYGYDKSKAIDNMNALINKSAGNRMALVIRDDVEQECLRFFSKC